MLFPVLAAFLLFCTTVHAQGEGDAPSPDEKPAPKTAPKPKAPPAADVDEDEPPPISKEQKEKARFHFRKGIKLLNEEAWAPALAEFLRSRELFPTREFFQLLT